MIALDSGCVWGGALTAILDNHGLQMVPNPKTNISRITIKDPEALPPLTVGLCCLGERLGNPLVKSLWDVAGQTYGRTV